MSDALDREAILQKLDAAREMVSALCRPRGSAGSREWTMSIPARPDYDPDIVITNALIAARIALEAADVEIAALQERAKQDASHRSCLAGQYIVLYAENARRGKALYIIRDQHRMSIADFEARWGLHETGNKAYDQPDEIADWALQAPGPQDSPADPQS